MKLKDITILQEKGVKWKETKVQREVGVQKEKVESSEGGGILSLFIVRKNKKYIRNIHKDYDISK